MRVFLDTNVIISGFATRGLCADIIRLVLAEHELVLGDVVPEEARRVFEQKLHLPEPLITDILAFLDNQIIEPRPKMVPSIRLRDKHELLVLASAVNAKADVLITGDKELLDINEQVHGVIITDPRGFWNLVQRKSKK